MSVCMAQSFGLVDLTIVVSIVYNVAINWSSLDFQESGHGR